MTPPEEYELYGDLPASEPTAADDGRTGRAAPPCAGCGSNDHEDGFVEGTDSQLRYYSGRRSVGVFGVKRFGLERRSVIARRCLVCSRLELFAGEVD